MKTSKQGYDLIKRWESCKLKAYRDGGGVWTIGWGTTSAAGFGTITRGMTITQETADEWLVRSVEKIYERAVNDALSRQPNQNQFDAMVCLCYNIGPQAFRESSVVRLFNAGQVNDAGNAFLMWNKDNGKVIPGLVNRRKSEWELYMTAVRVTPPDVEESEPKSKSSVPPKAIAGGLVALLLALAALIYNFIVGGN